MKHKPKPRKPTKYERIKRKKPIMFVCTGKIERARIVTLQEKNEHGAYNNINKSISYTQIDFQKLVDLNRAIPPGEDAPKVINAVFILETSDKEVAAKYEVGKEYKDLPLNV